MPSMDRIIGKGEKYLTTAVILLTADLDGRREIIFERRSPDIPQGDEVCFPGGRVDASVDASPRDTAVREACEELGLAHDQISVGSYLGTLLAPLGVAVDAFVGEIKIDSLTEIHPNATEVQSVFSMPVEWFCAHRPEEYQIRLEVQPFQRDARGNIEYLLPVHKLGLPERYHRPWGGRKLPVYVYRTGHGAIWGITAEILREYVKTTG